MTPCASCCVPAAEAPEQPLGRPPWAPTPRRNACCRWGAQVWPRQALDWALQCLVAGAAARLRQCLALLQRASCCHTALPLLHVTTIHHALHLHRTQASGWKVVCLDSQTVLQLPVAALADELGAQMMGAANRSSLAFCA